MTQKIPSEAEQLLLSQSVRKPPRGLWERIRETLMGPRRNVFDPNLGHKLSLVAFLAWVGLGADGLSSSAYGPAEAYHALGEHRYLALFLALASALTVFIISYSYSRIIEQFPTGGGGYLVTTKSLGAVPGAISGCALLVDYVLTITVSIAAGGDAVFSLLPSNWHDYKLPAEFAAVIFLIVMNLRGVKESVTALIPIFLIFVVSHIILILWGVFGHFSYIREVAGSVSTGFNRDMATIGFWGIFAVFMKAYSMGAGTYTGIEAVANGVGILREPRIETGKRTMVYMATSLAFTAAGLMVCYMLWHVEPQEGQTLNAVLANSIADTFKPAGIPIGHAFALVVIISEAVLLFVAAQTGFIDGPRVMASMAADAWLPRKFSALSDRLTMQNGVILMGGAALALLFYTKGIVVLLVIMYSINVFITFSLAQLSMVRFRWRAEKTEPHRIKNLIIHSVGFVLCFLILCVMMVEKISHGGWVTLVITFGLLAFCAWIHRHYDSVTRSVKAIDKTFASLPSLLQAPKNIPEYDPSKPTAAILVGGYGGLGIHLLLNVVRLFPDTFHNFHFLSVGAIDSKFFTGDDQIQSLSANTKAMMEKYVELAHKMGRPARYTFRIGTDVVEEASEICAEIATQCSKPVYFAGTLVFDRPRWYQRWLHNETAYAIQRRLRFQGLAILILPLPLTESKP